MLALRVLLILLLLVGLVLFGCYVFFGEVRYKQYFIQFLKITLYIVVISGLSMVVYQLFF